MHQGHAMAMLLRKAYLSFHRRANARIVKSGVTADQFVLLTILAEEDGVTQVTIVERTASDPNTVTAVLRLLERRGLIRRETHAHDGRARCVFLTPQGRRVQKRLAKSADVMLERLWNSVDAADRRILLGALSQIHSDFASQVPSPGRERNRSRRTRS